MTLEATTNVLTDRLREGFERIAAVLRADHWVSASEIGLNPVQVQVLALLAKRNNGLRQKDIARQLVVSPASMADTLAALSRKFYVERTADIEDARSIIVRITQEGRLLHTRIENSASQLSDAISALSPELQQALLQTQILLIRHLQEVGAIPIQRMCTSCRHFRPNANSGASKPHHCNFINADIGAQDLRLDCSDHEAAALDVQSANWASFSSDPPSLQAQN